MDVTKKNTQTNSNIYIYIYIYTYAHLFYLSSCIILGQLYDYIFFSNKAIVVTVNAMMDYGDSTLVTLDAFNKHFLR